MSGSASLVSSVKPLIRSYPHFKTHHLANELVKAARLELRDSGNLTVAYENLQNAYDIAIAIIRNVYVEQQGSAIPPESRLKQQGTPLGVAEELVEILSYDKIQEEHPLKYQVAKTLRIFLDLTFLIGKLSDLKINVKTHENMVQNIVDVLATLPSEEVKTKYELRCCLAAAIVLNDDFIETKAFVLAHAGSVVKAVTTKSPGELAQPMLELLKKLGRLVDTSWWTFVFPCHLKSRVVFSFEQQHAQNAFKMRTTTAAGKDVPDSIVDLYLKMHSDYLGQYKNYRESAFCVLEDLEEMMKKTIRAGGDQKLSDLILEGNGQNFPGIRAFMVIETPKISEFLTLFEKDQIAAIKLVRRQTFWKVQHRAIDVLFNVATDMLAPDVVWQKAITILVNRPIPSKKNTKVEQLYKLRLQSLKQYLSLPERGEFATSAAWEAKYKDERLKAQKYNEEIRRRGEFIKGVVSGKKQVLEDSKVKQEKDSIFHKAKEKARAALSKKTEAAKAFDEKRFLPEEQGEDGAKPLDVLEQEFKDATFVANMAEGEQAIFETEDALLEF